MMAGRLIIGILPSTQVIWVLKDRDGQSGLIGFCHEVDRQRSLESSVAFPTDLSCSPCSMRPDPVM